VPGISQSQLFRNDEAAMQGVPVEIVKRQIAHCHGADPEYGVHLMSGVNDV
jgi:catalase